MIAAGKRQLHAQRLSVDFLGLGVQRGGTNTLRMLLRCHPDVLMPALNEVHYFSNHYQRGRRWYSRHFFGRRPEHVIGEITPFYLFHPQAPDRIRRHRSDLKLIVLLRDPVTRALSHHRHSRRWGLEPLPLMEALEAEESRLSQPNAHRRRLSFQEHSYLSRSRYVEQIDRYLNLFPQDQLLMLRSEDLFEDQSCVWERLTRHLNLQSARFPGACPGLNAADRCWSEEESRAAGWLRERLSDTYRDMEQRFAIGW